MGAWAQSSAEFGVVVITKSRSDTSSNVWRPCCARWCVFLSTATVEVGKAGDPCPLPRPGQTSGNGCSCCRSSFAGAWCHVPQSVIAEITRCSRRWGHEQSGICPCVELQMPRWQPRNRHLMRPAGKDFSSTTCMAKIMAASMRRAGKRGLFIGRMSGEPIRQSPANRLPVERSR